MSQSKNTNGNKGRHSTPQISGTKEWAEYNVNCSRGCSHNCLYCYAADMADRFHRRSREKWPREDICKDVVSKGWRKRSGVGMFPTTHDITPNTLDACETVLLKLLAADNQVLVVSKPHLKCIDRLTKSLENYREQVQFRFTIGLVSENLRRFWEPGAPAIKERLACLRMAFERGYRTSISAEPLLEPWNVGKLVAAVRPYITDTLWIGKMNDVARRTRWILKPDDSYLVKLEQWQTNEKVMEIYEMFRGDPLVRWKESYKKVIGLPLAAKPGLDM